MSSYERMKLGNRELLVHVPVPPSLSKLRSEASRRVMPEILMVVEDETVDRSDWTARYFAEHPENHSLALAAYAIQQNHQKSTASLRSNDVQQPDKDVDDVDDERMDARNRNGLHLNGHVPNDDFSAAVLDRQSPRSELESMAPPGMVAQDPTTFNFDLDALLHSVPPLLPPISEVHFAIQCWMRKRGFHAALVTLTEELTGKPPTEEDYARFDAENREIMSAPTWLWTMVHRGCPDPDRRLCTPLRSDPYSRNLYSPNLRRFDVSSTSFGQNHDNNADDNDAYEDAVFDERSPDTAAFLGSIPPRSATVSQLVFRATSMSDPQFLRAFILTYKSFTTSFALLRRLSTRFSQSSDKQVRLRVCNILKQWMERCPFDFVSTLEKQLTDFITAIVSIAEPSAGASLSKALDAVVHGKEKGVLDASQLYAQGAPEPLFPRPGSTVSGDSVLVVEDVDPVEIARQMSLLEQEAYRRIRPEELLNTAWSKPKLRHRAPTVSKMISRFNKISLFVARHIVSAEHLRLRAKRMAFWIRVADCLRTMSNFNSVLAVMSGLQLSAVHRLKFTKEEVPKKLLDVLNSLNALMESNSSFKNYRSALHQCSPPCVPYLGVYLTDLTFIEDGNQDFLDADQKIVNWSKRMLVSSIISEVQQYQHTPYVFHPVYALQKLLETEWEVVTSEDVLYDESILREPRNCKKDLLA
eukprot:ANDGO_03792.mRNA.1 Ras guanine nucleotide exchange factor A